MTSSSRMSAQALAEGAILAALMAVLASASQYIPFVGVAATYLGPLPLAVLVLRHGTRVAVVAGVAGALVAAMLSGPFAGAAILILLAPMGIVLGIGARGRWPAARVIAIGSILSAISILIGMSILLGGGRASLSEIARGLASQMEAGLGFSASIYTRMGVPKAEIDGLTGPMRVFIQNLPTILPGIIITAGVMAAWLNYEVARRVLARFGYVLERLPGMRAWRLPDIAIWFPTLGIVMSVAGKVYQVPLLPMIGDSLLEISVLAFTFQGLIVLWVILGNVDFTPREQIVGVAIAVFLSMAAPIINIALLLLGILDTTFKVRSRWGVPRPTTASGAKP